MFLGGIANVLSGSKSIHISFYAPNLTISSSISSRMVANHRRDPVPVQPRPIHHELRLHYHEVQISSWILYGIFHQSFGITFYSSFCKFFLLFYHCQC